MCYTLLVADAACVAGTATHKEKGVYYGLSCYSDKLSSIQLIAVSYLDKR